MKIKIFTHFLLLMVLSSGLLFAQEGEDELLPVLFTEDFDYPSERPLILNPEPSNANFDELTGWSTQSNTLAADQVFAMTTVPLTYEGYSDGVGNALAYNGLRGQSVFKPFEQGANDGQTIYMSFLIRFDQAFANGSDFLLGLKMDANAGENNWGGRLYAQDDLVTGDFILGINKMSGGSTTWVNDEAKFVKPDETVLLVIKYYVGVLNGESAEEEAGNYDDEMWLFINPTIGDEEPAEADLYHADPDQRDIWRISSAGNAFGGARSMYLRSAAEGSVPSYAIDDIRVTRAWADLFDADEEPVSAGEILQQPDELNLFVANKQIHITDGNSRFQNYRVVNITGQVMLNGSLNDSNTAIDASGLKSGVYILIAEGDAIVSRKIFIE